jgi:hypothetical protein
MGNRTQKFEIGEIGLPEPPGPHCLPKTDDVKKERKD